MNASEISEVLSKQRAHFASGATLEREYRDMALAALYDAIKSHEAEIARALSADLGKSEAEAYMCETGLTLTSIRFLRRNLKRLMRPKRTGMGLAQLPGYGELRYVPYGTALIMSPWNYPLLLTLEPLAAALAAGNTAVIKPSAYAPATSELIAKLLGEVFTPEYVMCVTGGREENRALLHERWDKIFFTGSKGVGREVLRSAAENLTSVTLELGGKSPVIVDETADIALAAKRIVAGKYLNCGQTCVAPDYVLCSVRVYDALLAAIKDEISVQYPDALHDETYGRIVNRRHFERLMDLIAADKVAVGGAGNPDRLQIEPTVLTDVTPDDAVMQDEIFGPVLPLLKVSSLDEAIAFVESRPRPLALYLFTGSRENRERVLSRCRFGGGCVNDTVMHLTTDKLPFGGVGESGMGAYHGRWGFEEFSHLEGLLIRGSGPETSVRYRPWTEGKLSILRHLLR